MYCHYCRTTWIGPQDPRVTYSDRTFCSEQCRDVWGKHYRISVNDWTKIEVK